MKLPNNRSTRRQSRNTVAGFSLVEVLAALVIFSIGLLGLAGLQFSALRGNHGAYISTVASLQVIDAGDRIRANPVGVAAGNYDFLVADTFDPGCIAGGCSPANLANYDYWIWNQGDPAQPGTGNAQMLPQGEGVICLDSTPEDGTSRANHGCDGVQVNGSRVFAIKVWWDDDRDPATPLSRHVASVFP